MAQKIRAGADTIVTDPNPDPRLLELLTEPVCDGGNGEYDEFIPPQCPTDNDESWWPIAQMDGTVGWFIMSLGAPS